MFFYIFCLLCLELFISQPPFYALVCLQHTPLLVMNGPNAAKRIRELGSDSFIVGITGNVLPDDIAHFKQSGANWVFPKPVRIPDLEALWNEYGVTAGHPKDRGGGGGGSSHSPTETIQTGDMVNLKHRI